MNNLSLVLWLILFPLVIELSCMMGRMHRPADWVGEPLSTGTAATVIIWYVIIAFVLYRP